jgi:CDP-paratose 2-epimerase
MKIIVTGGAGFIGCNASASYMRQGDDVVVVDDLSRPGSDKNLAWLRELGRFSFEQCDIRDAVQLSQVFGRNRDARMVLHLAAQVAVTTSVKDPRHDFEVNALGTLNVLEAVRAHTPEAAVLYASTNKVYGGLEHVRVEEQGSRYVFCDLERGIAETEPLDFHSPYGCSKGAADQYVRDYARIYGLRAVSLRQSCIYGYRQFGVEDQGWVAWFTIAAVLGKPITIYGDGKQTRDVLFVEDLCDLYVTAAAKIDKVSGKVFNVGGGPAFQMSPLELIALLEGLCGRQIKPRFDAWRPGDQRLFVSNVEKVQRELGWRPRTRPDLGVKKLHAWVSDHSHLF